MHITGGATEKLVKTTGCRTILVILESKPFPMDHVHVHCIHCRLTESLTGTIRYLRKTGPTGKWWLLAYGLLGAQEFKEDQVFQIQLFTIALFSLS